MTETILKSILRLFAVVAQSISEDKFQAVRGIVESYLRQLVNPEKINQYLMMFDFYYKGLKEKVKLEDKKYHWIYFEFKKEGNASSESYKRYASFIAGLKIKEMIRFTRPLESALIAATGGVERVRRFDFLVHRAMSMSMIEITDRELFAYVKGNAHKAGFKGWFDELKRRESKKVVAVSTCIWKIANDLLNHILENTDVRNNNILLNILEEATSFIKKYYSPLFN